MTSKETAGPAARRRILSPVLLSLLATLLLTTVGCFPRVNLMPDAGDPLKAYTLEGEGKEKVALININGVISDAAHENFMTGKTPSLLQEVIAQLQMAEADPAVKALVLKINSPGGAITASDILYQKILRYKRKTGAPVVAAMMDVAASGGYYVALPADRIIAHPTTLTGSVGVIFMTPKVQGLMDKIGLDVDVRTSGRNKDMGSPFRDTTEEEAALFASLIRYYGDRFMSLVEHHRGNRGLAADEVATARIFPAAEALRVGLIDQVGYLEEALAAAKQLAGLPENARVIAYRRTAYPNDTIYNTLSTRLGEDGPSLINIDLLDFLPAGPAGLYYLWRP